MEKMKTAVSLITKYVASEDSDFMSLGSELDRLIEAKDYLPRFDGEHPNNFRDLGWYYSNDGLNELLVELNDFIKSDIKKGIITSKPDEQTIVENKVSRRMKLSF